jgi:AcrR family transcriptional regulator
LRGTRRWRSGRRGGARCAAPPSPAAGAWGESVCPYYILAVWSETHPKGQRGRRSFIEEARRAQIVGCAIDTIAELGYGQASLARIAERAGISKGVIGYHFAGKNELLAEVVAEVLEQAGEYMRPRIGAAAPGPAMLLAFMGAHRNQVIAIVEIARGAPRAPGGTSLDPRVLDGVASSLAQLLARFQETGEFRRDFDPTVMAAAIRSAIDAVPRRLATEPRLDVAHVGRELANLFDRATRSEMSAVS